MVNDQLASAAEQLPKTVTSAERIAEIFTDKQVKEIAFCDAKTRKAQVEELLLGVVHPSEVSNELVALAEAYCSRQAKNQRDRTNEQKLVQRKVTQKAVSWHESFASCLFGEACFSTSCFR